VDAILTTLGGSLPQLGVGGVLAFVVGLLVKLLVDERTRHTADLDAQQKRHAAELEAKGKRLADDDARDDAERARLLKRIAELEGLVDTERALRRTAEDTAARALRGVWEEPST
jgi:hypothetical protein